MNADLFFIIFLILGFVLLAVAVLMFFVFNIPEIITIKTGKGVKLTKKRMAERNSGTGKLRNAYMVAETSGQLAPKKTEKRSGKLSEKPADAQEPPQKVTQQLSDADAGTGVLSLDGSTVEGNAGTSVLTGNDSRSSEPVPEYRYTRTTNGLFRITYDLRFINSDEII